MRLLLISLFFCASQLSYSQLDICVDNNGRYDCPDQGGGRGGSDPGGYDDDPFGNDDRDRQGGGRVYDCSEPGSNYPGCPEPGPLTWDRSDLGRAAAKLGLNLEDSWARITGGKTRKQRQQARFKQKVQNLNNLFDQAEALSQEAERLNQEIATDIRAMSHESFLKREEIQGKIKKIVDEYNENLSEVIDNLPQPKEGDFKDLPRTSPEHFNTRIIRDYNNYAKRVIAQTNGPMRKEQEALTLFADAALNVADRAYTRGHLVSGNEALNLGIAATDLALSLTPGVSWGKDIYEAITGEKLVDGSKLDAFDRTMAVLGAVTGGIGSKLGTGVKAAKAGMDVFDSIVDAGKAADGLGDAVKTASGVLDSANKIGLSKPERVKQLAETASKAGVKPGKFGETLENIGKSDDFARAVRSTPVNKPMFYVKPTGEAIPSTAYRYVGSDAKYLDDFVKNGQIPSGNYYSFDKIDDMTQASSKLQVPHDARYRAEFDTLPYVDKTRIPNGDWGKADYLEPITKDFPGFGQGGATQAVIDGEVAVSKIIDLKTGQVVFER